MLCVYYFLVEEKNFSNNLVSRLYLDNQEKKESVSNTPIRYNYTYIYRHNGKVLFLTFLSLDRYV